jgi:hypothetical protein
MSAPITYQVGKWYRVPTVRGEVHGLTRDWPVLGPEHEDREIINFPYDHYHLDWRFVEERFLEKVEFYPGRLYAVVLFGDTHVNPGGLPKPIMKIRKCKRQFPHFPRRRAHWMAALERKHAGCRLKSGRVCPHRGVPLDSIPADADGHITCPAHGLRWRADTGELAPTWVAQR